MWFKIQGRIMQNVFLNLFEFYLIWIFIVLFDLVFVLWHNFKGGCVGGSTSRPRHSYKRQQ
jgi:hypothetical protein